MQSVAQFLIRFKKTVCKKRIAAIYMKNHFIDLFDDQFCEILQNTCIVLLIQKAISFNLLTEKDTDIISSVSNYNISKDFQLQIFN